MLAYLFAVMLKGTPFWLPPSGRLTAGLTSIPILRGLELAVGHGGYFFCAGAAEFISNFFLFNSVITGVLGSIW
jgi:hypothetical protein